jgi:cyclophilin family peptidyl-prolyl cis-trans isomerase
MRAIAVIALVLAPSIASAQNFAQRLAVIQAEGRGAKAPSDLQTIRLATRSGDTDTVRLAIRTMGRLQRPALVPEILGSLRHMQPEVRSEAANALAEAARGLKPPFVAASPVTVVSIQTSLISRLPVEEDATVRAAIADAIARLPYRTAAEVEHAESAILEFSTKATIVADRLAVAKALEALIRLQSPLRPASPEAVARLKDLVRLAAANGPDLPRDARIRRLALEALTAAAAVDTDVLEQTVADADPQVRRLAMRAAGLGDLNVQYILDGLLDRAAMVRAEALQALASRDRDAVCSAAIRGATDAELSVALAAVDMLGTCGSSSIAVAHLERSVFDRSELAAIRGWHHNAHALLALATAAPERVIPALPDYARSEVWQVRMYTARAALQAKDRQTLETLAGDSEPRVATIARAALGMDASRAKARPDPPASGPFTAAELSRLAAPTALITIRDVGRVELALLTNEAPAAVLRFARLAEAGYYDGVTFDRVATNAVVQGGWRADGNARYPEEEVGDWPHVRGTVAVSESFAPDGQFFINLVDSPKFDHKYTVFAQVLNGSAVIDRILEGDVIESIEIIP